jgi:hypothetical protein
MVDRGKGEGGDAKERKNKWLSLIFVGDQW